jgi:uncharacterized membrane protein
MRENVGHIDRIVRFVVGPGLLALGLDQLRRGHFAGVLGVIGGTMLVESAITRVCPITTALGIDTRSTGERITDFRDDVNQQSDRIAHDYAAPITVEQAPFA